MTAAKVARFLGIAIVVAALVYALVSIWDRDALMQWMSRAHPVPFFVLMALVTALGVPFTPFFVVAGAAFGAPLALVGSLLALTVNLCLCYAIASSALRPRLQTLLARFDYDLPDFTGGGRKAWRFAALVKVTPALPAFAKSYGLALTGLPFPIYMTVSVLIGGVFAAMWILLGTSVFDHDVGYTVWIAIALLVAIVVLLRWWQRRRESLAAS